jgi:hypothetical protein
MKEANNLASVRTRSEELGDEPAGSPEYRSSAKSKEEESLLFLSVKEANWLASFWTSRYGLICI